jgi:hypothetical protein
MLEVLTRARQQVRAIEAAVVGPESDFSPREIELWQHIPYLCKLNDALRDMSVKNHGVGIRAIRGLVAIGAFISAVGGQLVGETQLERDIKAIKKYE